MGNECSNEACCNNCEQDKACSDMMLDSFEHNFNYHKYEIESAYCNKCKKNVNYPDNGLSDGSSSICECNMPELKLRHSQADPNFSFAQIQHSENLVSSQLVENIQK